MSGHGQGWERGSGARGRERRARPATGRRYGTPTWTPPWRKGIPETPKEDPAAPGAGSPAAIGEVLDGLLATAGPWQAGLATGELGRRWADVVGEPLASETAPRGLDARGTLTVAASSGAWAAQLRFLRAAIAANANEVLGHPAVIDVRVVVDPDVGARAGSEEAPRGPGSAR
jgi:predicted nucleic acid-binding Zn ribbon protein